jgi:hypothetical protein
MFLLAFKAVQRRKPLKPLEKIIAPEFENSSDEPKDVQTVINSFDKASRTYTAEYFFAINLC